VNRTLTPIRLCFAGLCANRDAPISRLVYVHGIFTGSYEREAGFHLVHSEHPAFNACQWYRQHLSTDRGAIAEEPFTLMSVSPAKANERSVQCTRSETPVSCHQHTFYVWSFRACFRRQRHVANREAARKRHETHSKGHRTDVLASDAEKRRVQRPSAYQAQVTTREAGSPFLYRPLSLVLAKDLSELATGRLRTTAGPNRIPAVPVTNSVRRIRYDGVPLSGFRIV